MMMFGYWMRIAFEYPWASSLLPPEGGEGKGDGDLS